MRAPIRLFMRLDPLDDRDLMDRPFLHLTERVCSRVSRSEREWFCQRQGKSFNRPELSVAVPSRPTATSSGILMNAVRCIRALGQNHRPAHQASRLQAILQEQLTCTIGIVVGFTGRSRRGRDKPGSCGTPLNNVQVSAIYKSDGLNMHFFDIHNHR